MSDMIYRSDDWYDEQERRIGGRNDILDGDDFFLPNASRIKACTLIDEGVEVPEELIEEIKREDERIAGVVAEMKKNTQ